MTHLDITQLHLNQTHVIEASAGTGKTHAIVSIVLRLIAEGYRIDQILVVTFTEAATAELRDRIRVRLRETLNLLDQPVITDPLIGSLIAAADANQVRRRLHQAVMTFDEAAVFTIHGFCNQILQAHAFESGILFDARLQTDPGTLYADIAADFWARTAYSAPVLMVHSLLQNGIGPESLADLMRLVARKPEIHIIPDPPECINPLTDITPRYQAVRHLWKAHEAEILSILEKSMDSLHARYYKREWLAEWQKVISEWLKPPEPVDPAIPLELSRLSGTELAAKTKKGKQTPVHDFFDACERLMQSLDRLNDWFLKLKHDGLRFSRNELENRKNQQRILFFEDLINRLDHALQEPGGALLAHRIRTRFPAALIDEFQDTDPIQYRIFQTLYRNSDNPFFMIGDPKQSIYGFRGADIFAYLKAVEGGSARTYNLGINWRSDFGLIHAVNTLFQQHADPFLFSRIRFHPVMAPTTPVQETSVMMRAGQPVSPMSIMFIQNCAAGPHLDSKSGRITRKWMNQRLPAQVAHDIADLLQFGSRSNGTLSRPLSPGDIAVLVRTNRQARAIQDALRDAAIPSVLESAESVWHSREAEMLWHVLKAVADPRDFRRIAAGLTTDLFGLNAHDIWELGRDEMRWDDWIMRFRDWHDIWKHRGLIPMMNRLLGMEDSRRSTIPLARLIGFPDGERRVSNVLHLIELLHQAARDQGLEIPGLIQWFEARQNSPHTDSESAELRLESDARAVRLTTVHKSKGLEYPVVFCPFLWEGRRRADSRFPVLFHDPENQDRMTLDLGSDQQNVHLARSEEEELAERLRLLYVALTRARHHCVIYTGDVRGIETSALGYLLHPTEPTEKDHLEHPCEDILLSDLDRLVTAGSGSIGLRHLPEMAGADSCVPHTHVDAVELVHHHVKREIFRDWRISSFSEMTSSKHILPADLSEGRDHDITALSAEAGERLQNFAVEEPDGSSVPLHQFDRGPVAGIFFHTLFEHLDFASTDSDALASLVNNHLSRAGMDSTRWAQPVYHAVSDILDTPLDATIPGLCLRQISMNQRMNELEFLIPATRSVSEKAHQSMTASTLFTLFESESSPKVPDAYLQQLKRLQFPAIQGFLKGFMDLVFEHEGKWHVVDYKSNMLGPRYGDYAAPFLEQAMTEHHYYLQYHLYVTALHRYLTHRLPDYDYDRHMGAVYYLFIRGMSKTRGPAFGVFRDRPPTHLIYHLSELFQ